MNKKGIILSFFLIFFTITFSQNKVDLLLYNGKIYSLDNKNRIFSALCIKDGKIVELGKSEILLKKYVSEKKINLKGNIVFPGFIEGHGHLINYGKVLSEVDLFGTKSIDEIIAKISNAVENTKKGEWIFGSSWDQNNWNDKNWPDGKLLNAVSPDNPVCLTRIDRHAIWVNKKVLDLAGITKETKSPDGGFIIRDNNGNPTGILIDNATDLIYNIIPAKEESEIEKAILNAQEKLLNYGIVEFQDMGISKNRFEILTKLYNEGKFKIRYRGYIDGSSDFWNCLIQSGKKKTVSQNDMIKIVGVKIYADGALGSRGAALTEPYNDDKNNSGLAILKETEIYEITKKALENGLQVTTHAIGDKAINITINAYQKAIEETGIKDHRLRIEHVQVLNPSDAERIAKLNIVPSMQPTHCTSDMYWAEARLGMERIKWAYAWNTVLKYSPLLIGGSDVPIESPNILEGIYAAVTRKDKNGHPKSFKDMKELINKKIFIISEDGISDEKDFQNGWYSKQKVTRLQAINMFTKWPAFAVFEEKQKGILEKDKFADLTVLDKDISVIPSSEILKTNILMTIVNGNILINNFSQ